MILIGVTYMQENLEDIKTPQKAYKYAYQISKPVPELENIIARDPKCSYWYAKNINRKRKKGV